MKIAIVGKGGAGKTTLAASLARTLARAGRSVVAVDADPDGNLASALGVSPERVPEPIVRMRNPVDIWFAAGLHGVEFGYREGIRAALQDPNIDAVVPILLLTDETGVPPLDFIVDLSQDHPEKPIYVTFSGEKKHMEAGKAFLEPRGVPTYQWIEEPFEVLSILTRCRNAMERS